MLVFNFFKIGAKVLQQSVPWEKCVQKRAFVAKFSNLWRNSGIFVAKFPTTNKKRRKICVSLGVILPNSYIPIPWGTLPDSPSP